MRRPPEGGWPLDELLVGVGTLRTLRELFRQAELYEPRHPLASPLDHLFKSERAFARRSGRFT